MTSRRSIRPHARLLVSAALILLASAAPAQEAEPVAEAQPSTRIETDEAAHVVRVIIDGREVATFDRKGLQVEGDLVYSGDAVDLPASKPADTPDAEDAE